MNLQQQLQWNLAHSSLRDIALLMGYTKVKAHKAALRIANVLSDSQMGMYANAFDFKLSNQEFLSELCRVIGINISDFKDELDAIHYDHDDRRDRYKSYIFIDTNFKRAGQSLISMSFCDSQRYLKLDYEVRVKKLSEQVEYVKSIVRQHYIKTEGNIGLWGDIQRYVFFYAEGCQLALNPDGVLLDEPEHVDISRATLKVGNADLKNVL